MNEFEAVGALMALSVVEAAVSLREGERVALEAAVL